ncbi:MAG TPA: B12-binding domain-containing radical SAM protein, partial [Candidatus Competibacteraceae bacterium]|nr:B12-binding domain-containing radical SAM protein [Candidatus Competibacteraceae bacterium]
MPTILLTTLNARYFHSSFGLRYLLANMGDLQARTTIQEFIITQRPLDIAEAILATQPRIIGFGVYTV